MAQMPLRRSTGGERLEVVHDDLDGVLVGHAAQVSAKFVQQPIVEDDIEHLLAETSERALPD